MAQELDTHKASLYGQLIEAAYAMYKKPGADPLKPEPINIPAQYELGAWIQMSDFLFGDELPKFYGIVVHRKENPDSRIIAIRGTDSAIEWIDDGFAIPVPFKQVPSAGRVACGFDRIYSTMKVIKRLLPAASAAGQQQTSALAPGTFAGSFAEQLDQEVRSREAERGLAIEPRPERPTAVTGHSLGAALATLFVMENSAKRKFDVSTVCTFASPRVGNLEFVHLFNQLKLNSWRIVNSKDIVPRLPLKIPVLADYEHVDTEYRFDSSRFAKNGLICWHTMETYLHWVDPSTPLSPTCTP